MADLPGRQGLGQGVEIELRIGSGPRRAADVDDQFDTAGPQQLDELGDAAGGMAYRVDGVAGGLRIAPISAGTTYLRSACQWSSQGHESRTDA